MKQWRCKVCGYIHTGPEPPDICPVCGAPKEEFEEITAGTEVTAPAGGPSAVSVVPLTGNTSDVQGALFTLSYGLFLLSSREDGRYNGQTSNTVFQITADPRQIALGVNKANLTHEYIISSGVCAVTILGQGDLDLVRRFGFQSGRNADKFAGLQYSLGPVTGCPLLPGGVAYLEGRINPKLTTDTGTHTLFIADVVGGGVLAGGEPLTYDYYRRNKTKPAG